MFRLSRTTELWALVFALVVVSAALWIPGALLDNPTLRFCGFMIGGSTFAPMPADAYVLAASVSLDPLTIGVVGGFINGLVVLAEARWMLRFAEMEQFSKFREFIGTNKWIDLAEERMFFGLIIAGISFLPFEPFRLVAALRRYSPSHYFLATFIGRGFRYYWIARAGEVFANFGVIKYAVWASLAFFGVGLLRSYQRFAETK